MKNFQTQLWSITLIFILTLSACQSNKSSRNDQEKPEQIEKERITKLLKDVIYPLPSSNEVAELMQKIHASYTIGLTNNPSHAEKYSQDIKKAINLGVYLTDISYITTYNQQSLIPQYVKACETLVEDLDMNNAFSKDMVERIEANIDNKSTLVKELSSMLHYSYAYLSKHKKEELAALVMYGSWLEGMFLTLNITEFSFNSIEMINSILFQEKSLNTLLEETKPYKDSLWCKNAYANLAKVKQIFDTEEGTESLTETQLKALHVIVGKLRAEVVAP